MTANHRVSWTADGMPTANELQTTFDPKRIAAKFDAAGFGEQMLRAHPGLRQDAASGIALARQLEHLSQVVSQEPVKNLNSFDAFPVVPDPPAPFMETYSWLDVTYNKGRVSRSYDDHGQTSGNLAAGPKSSQFITPYIGHASYTVQDVGIAALTGMPIPSWKLAAERRAIEESVNVDNWFGNADWNVSGVYDNANITKAVVANGALGSPLWSNKTPDEIEKDMTDWWNTQIALIDQASTLNSPSVNLYPDRCILSVAALSVLATTARSQLSGMTILQYLEQTFQRVSPGFKFVAYNELASNGSGSAWGMLYRYDPMIAGRVVSLPTTFMQPSIEMFRTVIPVHAQAGGICIRYPVAMLIRYGM